MWCDDVIDLMDDNNDCNGNCWDCEDSEEQL